ncbi:MAG: hypothetical protein JO250_07740 [Armatimonadetes bacterium]|nr:hypothetical protein [Armatimonadota bacterium]
MSGRDDYYLWHDESGLHIWASDGYDGWDEAGWHRDDEGNIHEWHLQNGENKASGVSIHQEVIDEYVVMRLAQMIEEGVVEETIKRAVRNGSTRGSNWLREVLQKKAAKLQAALAQVKPDEAQ